LHLKLAQQKKTNSRYNMRNLLPLYFLAILFGTFLSSCQENDDVPPIISMNGADTVYHVLNEVYIDDGATATDETDGNLTNNIFVDNQVDENRIGEYSINYIVVDKAGNEAPQVSRIVFVNNNGIVYYGDYEATDKEVFPGQENCIFPSYIWVDSTVNNRLVFLDFACSSKREVFADVYDSIIIMPFQLIQDSLVNMSLQGAGYINDSVVYFEYTKIDSIKTSYWNVTFNRVK